MEPSVGHVPVFMDNSGYSGELGLSRFSYFFVEFDEPGEAAAPFEGYGAIPFLLMDLEGVILTPLGDRTEFDTPDTISDLLEFIHEKTPYVVSTSYIWLPDEILRKHVGADLKRGDVVRVAAPLFVRACRHARTPAADAFDDMLDLDRAVIDSPVETESFRKWTDRTVERVRKRYRSDTGMNLKERRRGKES
jgi:hypothetical protein